jgi:peptidoglycan/LPS O-acetylase OafA/YrhL
MVVAGCLILASGFWWAIERPSHAFAKRIRTGAKQRVAAVAPPLQAQSPAAGDQ